MSPLLSPQRFADVRTELELRAMSMGRLKIRPGPLVHDPPPVTSTEGTRAERYEAPRCGAERRTITGPYDDVFARREAL